jgi:uncharacterized membrane protein
MLAPNRIRIVRQGSDEATGGSRVLALFVLGFFIVLLGIIILAVATLVSGGSASYGGVIFIGPIPIVFGAGPRATWLISFAIVLAALSIIVFLLMRRRTWKAVLYSSSSSLP